MRRARDALDGASHVDRARNFDALRGYGRSATHTFWRDTKALADVHGELEADLIDQLVVHEVEHILEYVEDCGELE